MEEVVDLIEGSGATRATPFANVLAKTFNVSVGLAILRSEAYKCTQPSPDWGKAKDCLFSILEKVENFDDITPVQMRQIYMGLAECAYHLKAYERSIAASEASLEMNRHFPGVHRYKALS